MTKIETIDQLQPYLAFNLSYLQGLFGGDYSQWNQVRESVEAIMKDGHSADLPVITEDSWKIVLNVRPQVPETRPEMHRDWHDVSLYLTGSNDITVGEEMSGA